MPPKDEDLQEEPIEYNVRKENREAFHMERKQRLDQQHVRRRPEPRARSKLSDE